MKTVPLASNHHGSCKFVITPDIRIYGLFLGVLVGYHSCYDGHLLTAIDKLVGKSLHRRRVLLEHRFPYRLSFQTSQGELHHTHLPP